MAPVQVYITSVTSNLETKKEQQRIKMILDGKKIAAEYIDIAADESAKDEMRRLAGNPTALPPQICVNGKHKGGYEEFDVAVEEETLDEFLS